MAGRPLVYRQGRWSRWGGWSGFAWQAEDALTCAAPHVAAAATRRRARRPLCHLLCLLALQLRCPADADCTAALHHIHRPKLPGGRRAVGQQGLLCGRSRGAARRGSRRWAALREAHAAPVSAWARTARTRGAGTHATHASQRIATVLRPLAAPTCRCRPTFSDLQLHTTIKQKLVTGTGFEGVNDAGSLHGWLQDGLLKASRASRCSLSRSAPSHTPRGCAFDGSAEFASARTPRHTRPHTLPHTHSR